MDNEQDTKKGAGFASFALTRMVIVVLIFCAVLWALTFGLGYLKNPEVLTSKFQGQQAHELPHDVQTKAAKVQEPEIPPAESESKALTENSAEPSPHATPGQTMETGHQEVSPAPAEEHEAKVIESPGSPSMASSQAGESKPAVATQSQPKEETPAAQPHTTPHQAVKPTHLPVGVAFVQAVIEPMDYELNKRFWGWRPNDILNFTDNINQFQLGVLEVTRRTAVQLAERISRTGSTDAFNRHLENTMNWLMIKADSYWFPTPESKYKESLKELEAYRDNLMAGKASFYTRTDNLIPLLAAFEDLLGSCDENLVKEKEEGGDEVSVFKADDYFYYAKGIASALATILEATQHDFSAVLENRNGAELLHHAIASCRRAASLEPWFITDGKLDGILANHRANMAAPISHARFYLGQLIKTLST